MSIMKARKLLLTLKLRYGYDPREVQRLLNTGRLPTKVEWAFMKMLDSNKIGDALSDIAYARRSIEGMIVKISGEWLVDIKELEKKGYFYQRLPSEISSYFEQKNKNEHKTIKKEKLGTSKYRKRCMKCNKMFNTQRNYDRYCPSCLKEKMETHYKMGA